MDKQLHARVKSLKNVEDCIARYSDAGKSYARLQANGLSSKKLFAELVGWVVLTVVDNRHFRRKNLKTETYFPKKVESWADEIQTFNNSRLFTPDDIEHNDLPSRLRAYAEQFRRQLKDLKPKGQLKPTARALSSLRWLVEDETRKKASPACLARILEAVLDDVVANSKDLPSYDFEANLKKIPPSSFPLSATK
jgi:hypothetical protein